MTQLNALQTLDISLHLDSPDVLPAGKLCLEFANTSNWHASEHPVESLYTYEELIDWTASIGLRPASTVGELKALATQQPSLAQQVYAWAIELREAIYHIFVAIAEQRAPTAVDLALLNEALPRAYTLDEIRYSAEVRDRMPRIDLDTITFESGSWDVSPDQYNRLAPIADGIKRAIAQNPNEVFLIEGHTDATGNEDDNLSLSDRRAESVSIILTDQFQIPPENLTTQGYGEQQPKVQTEGAERANRPL